MRLRESVASSDGVANSFLRVLRHISRCDEVERDFLPFPLRINFSRRSGGLAFASIGTAIAINFFLLLLPIDVYDIISDFHSVVNSAVHT